MPDQSTDFGPRQWAAFVPPGRGKQWPWKKGNIGMFALGLLAVIGAATAYWSVQHFQDRLDKSARADLATAGVELDNLEFDWTYRNLELRGEVSGDLDDQQIIEILRSTDGGGIRDIKLQLTTVREEPEPVIEKGTIDVVATLSDGQILLAGSVLTETQRTRLYDAAAQAVGTQNVLRQIGVSGLQEAIPGADQRIESFANSLAGLDQATAADAALSATDLRFNATVDDENQVDELLARRGTAGDVGLVISGDIIAKKSAPGGVMDISVVKKDDRIVLSGVVISDLHKQQLLEAANAVVGEALVDDQITVVSNTDDIAVANERMAILLDAVSTFPQTIEARAAINVSDFNFDALVEYEEQTADLYAIRDSAANRGLSVVGNIESRLISLDREVDLLQQELDLLAVEIQENVVFESSKFELDFDAKQTLDKVVDAMNRYQRPVVLVAGHTDSSGARIDNELLSLERASAVREYLEISGIDQLRLRSVGYGEAAPVATNDTEIGKKRNRRVEFSARRSFNE